MENAKVSAEEKPIIFNYLRTILRNAEKCTDGQARLALKHAAQNVAAHLEGQNMTDVFEQVIQRYKTVDA